jgi:hypothetical protein
MMIAARSSKSTTTNRSIPASVSSVLFTVHASVSTLLAVLQVAASIWNRIAEAGTPRSPIGQLFPLSQEEQNQAHQREADRLQKMQIDPDVVSAYLEVAPLLAERELIAKYKDQHPARSTFLNEALPEVNTIQEAVLLSTRERRLTRKQQQQLSELLKKLNSFVPNVPRSGPQTQSTSTTSPSRCLSFTHTSTATS